MKGWLDELKNILYVFPQTPAEIPNDEGADYIAVDIAELDAWVDENEELSDRIFGYNYNTMTVLKKEWADYMDEDIPGKEPPAVLPLVYIDHCDQYIEDAPTAVDNNETTLLYGDFYDDNWGAKLFNIELKDTNNNSYEAYYSGMEIVLHPQVEEAVDNLTLALIPKNWEGSNSGEYRFYFANDEEFTMSNADAAALMTFYNDQFNYDCLYNDETLEVIPAVIENDGHTVGLSFSIMDGALPRILFMFMLNEDEYVVYPGNALTSERLGDYTFIQKKHNSYTYDAETGSFDITLNNTTENLTLTGSEWAALESYCDYDEMWFDAVIYSEADAPEFVGIPEFDDDDPLNVVLTELDIVDTDNTTLFTIGAVGSSKGIIPAVEGHYIIRPANNTVLYDEDDTQNIYITCEGLTPVSDSGNVGPWLKANYSNYTAYKGETACTITEVWDDPDTPTDLEGLDIEYMGEVVIGIDLSAQSEMSVVFYPLGDYVQTLTTTLGDYKLIYASQSD